MDATHGSPCRAALPILQPLLHALMPNVASGCYIACRLGLGISRNVVAPIDGKP